MKRDDASGSLGKLALYQSVRVGCGLFSVRDQGQRVRNPLPRDLGSLPTLLHGAFQAERHHFPSPLDFPNNGAMIRLGLMKTRPNCFPAEADEG